MSTTPTSKTHDHHRIVLVGRAALLCEHSSNGDSSCRLHIIRTKNLYDAIGEISTAPSCEPVGLIVLTPETIHNASDRALEIIRRIVPGARIVIAVEDEPQQQQSNMVSPDMFDAHIAAPIDASQLMQLLNGEMNEVIEPASTGMSRESIETSTHQSMGETGGKGSVRDSTPRHRATDEIAQQQQHEAHVPQNVAASDEPLGDVDLVDALHNRPDRVRELAIQLIRQQTGWDDLQFIAEPDVSQGTPVEHQGDVYGRLHTSRASEDQIAPWAVWLARWLALDAAHQRYRYLAFHDELTGAWNRRYFMTFLAECIERAAPRRRPITVMVFDIDDFKQYNDTFGHSAGDEILRESVRLLTSVIRKGDRVCRIGGDEFAVIFADIEGPREPGSQHPESIEQIARRFQNEICQMHFPKLGMEAPGTLSISGGLATYPWDGRTAEELLERADSLALESKHKGKNVITLGPGAQQRCCDTNEARHWSSDAIELPAEHSEHHDDPAHGI